MYKILSTVLLIASIVWIYYFLNKSFIAVTDNSMWRTISWAWTNQYGGKATIIFFSISVFIFWTMFISWTINPISNFFSTPKTYVEVGEESLNNYNKYYAEDDVTHKIVRLQSPDNFLGKVHLRYSSNIDLFFKKHVFLTSDMDESTFSAARNHNLAPYIFMSILTYVMLTFIIATMKDITNAYMLQHQQIAVTWVAALEEYLIVFISLFSLNMVALVASFFLFTFNIKPHLVEDFKSVYEVTLKPGDRVKVEVLDNGIRRTERDGGMNMYGYIETVLNMEGAPSAIYPVITFSFKRTKMKELEAFMRRTKRSRHLEVEVSEVMTLMPVELLGNNAIDWEDY